MATDLAGNTLSRAKRIVVGAAPKVFKDAIGGSDRNDYFRFYVGARSSLTLVLNQLTANADLALLNRKGKLITRSARNGKRSELIARDIDPGVYFVQVYPRSASVRTRYRLIASQVAVPSRPFNIQFDYRFDTIGWFTPERRADLDAAADIWERILLDDFADIPSGTITPFITNPQTGQTVANVVNTQPIDDLLIFVGARNLSFLALGGPSGYYLDEPRYVGNRFQPWAGSISFKSNANWFFDPTPSTRNDIPVGSDDFISTAVHEIGHVLGFGTSVAFDNLVSSFSFVGANARAVNGGNPVPLASDNGHILDGYEFGGSGELLMDPRPIAVDARQLPTVIDAAMLADIGYTVDYSATYQNPSANTGLFREAAVSSRRTYARCGCLGCLLGTSRLADSIAV